MAATTEGSLDPAYLERRAAEWFGLWGVHEVDREVRVEVSRRMTRSLGRCYSDRGLIRMAAYLERADSELVEEVLCHEAAHLAAYRLHGRHIKPHGPEWKGLMRQAGYGSNARFRSDCLPADLLPPSPARFEHRCPICDASRLARRRMKYWRCKRCHDAGLGGRLEVRTLA